MTRPVVPPLVLVLVLWLAGLGAAAQFAKMAVVLPELQAFYGETGAASGFLVSLISLIGIVFGMIAGLLAIRIGLRRLLLIGLGLGALVSFAQALMPSFPLMLAVGALVLSLVVFLTMQATPKYTTTAKVCSASPSRSKYYWQAFADRCRSW